MSTLTEIEQAAESLPSEEKRQLAWFLLSRLRGEGDELPPTRDIPKAKIEAWIADDEAGHRDFLAQK